MMHRSNSPADTRELARRLAQDLEPGSKVLLTGTLGMGKTLFAAACIAELGVEGHISSPTFSIANVYDVAATGHRVIHCDFYRLESLNQLANTGVVDLMDDAVTLVEWGDKINALDYDFHVDITPGPEDSRNIEIKRL